MTIDEIKKKKAVSERLIAEFVQTELKAFADVTGCVPSGIALDFVTRHSPYPPDGKRKMDRLHVTNCEIEVRL